MTTIHTQLVLNSLDIDPLSDEVEQLRSQFQALERGDPGLYMDRIRLYAAHALKIGEKPPAERQPEGIALM